ncbi:hypothetical protein EOS_02665 [Caballeronia mineralivorans PML1(12)]|uniref:DUF7669 domain-containing protein n=1 Tax=Caballeronia mineralivorans PML1(12) TaxID=908627 RepID=A0A0J1D4Z0_9BURK|nr:hypothetical protein [Caballeronia mineralivorans]KLU27777.1 hypothetical protein EOS_02665 [Caballeronia mineralivorans PML1(12)]
MNAATNRPPIWQLIRDAIAPLGREVTYPEVKQFLWAQYPDLKSETINCQLIICSVNAPSRVHPKPPQRVRKNMPVRRAPLSSAHAEMRTLAHFER